MTTYREELNQAVKPGEEFTVPELVDHLHPGLVSYERSCYIRMICNAVLSESKWGKYKRTGIAGHGQVIWRRME